MKKLVALNEEELPILPKDLNEYELNQFYEERANSYELHEQLARQAAISEWHCFSKKTCRRNN